MELNEDLKVTNIDEFETNEEYYIEFIQQQNTYYTNIHNGVYILFEKKYSHYVKADIGTLSFKKRESDTSVYNIIYCYGSFYYFLGDIPCNIYKIPATKYILK